MQVREGLYYNPYFPGGAIAMPKMLVDGGADYDDGTPSSASQQAKDVTSFLAWASYPYQVRMCAYAPTHVLAWRVRHLAVLCLQAVTVNFVRKLLPSTIAHVLLL